jgi:hypothetical protein
MGHKAEQSPLSSSGISVYSYAFTFPYPVMACPVMFGHVVWVLSPLLKQPTHDEAHYAVQKHARQWLLQAI